MCVCKLNSTRPVGTLSLKRSQVRLRLKIKTTVHKRKHTAMQVVAQEALFLDIHKYVYSAKISRPARHDSIYIWVIYDSTYSHAYNNRTQHFVIMQSACVSSNSSVFPSLRMSCLPTKPPTLIRESR